MSSAPPLAAPLVETTEDRLRRELSQSSQAEARESLLREECARLRADNRALKRAEARRLAPPSAALYGPATRKALEGPLLTGGELVVASKERPPAKARRRSEVSPRRAAHASRMRGNPG